MSKSAKLINVEPDIEIAESEAKKNILFGGNIYLPN